MMLSLEKIFLLSLFYKLLVYNDFKVNIFSSNFMFQVFLNKKLKSTSLSMIVPKIFMMLQKL